MIDGDLVRLHEQIGAEIPDRLPVGADFEHGLAACFLAAVDAPEIVLVIDRDRVDRRPTARRRRPIRHQTVRIGQIVRTRITRLRLSAR